MTAVARPRGPLPARVYWTRRLLVLVVALGLVFGLARLLGSGGGGGTGPSAQPVGADESTASVTGSLSATADPTPTAEPTYPSEVASSTTPRGTRSGAVTTPLAEPTGACPADDVVAVPSVKPPAYAAKPVVITVTLSTAASPACTWTVSARSLVVKVTSGSDRIWSSQQCTRAVPEQAVVLRRDAPVSVSVIWNGLRSDSDCSRSTTWAENGYYHVAAAAFGGDPSDVQFQLRVAAAATETVTPTPTATATRTATPKGSPTASGTRKPAATRTKR
jgi:hypothetical protein